jgi:hypothetical protein
MTPEEIQEALQKQLEEQERATRQLAQTMAEAAERDGGY